MITPDDYAKEEGYVDYESLIFDKCPSIESIYLCHVEERRYLHNIAIDREAIITNKDLLC